MNRFYPSVIILITGLIVPFIRCDKIKEQENNIEEYCPPDMVLVPAGEYEYGSPREHIYLRKRGKGYLPSFCIDKYEYPNKKGAMPKNYVTWKTAKELCELEGKRLCKEAEWDKACQGPEGWRYAYGNEKIEGRCNTTVPPGAIGDASYIRPSGSFEECKSYYGVYDIEGNLSEWVEDWFDEAAGLRAVRGSTMWEAVYFQECSSRHGHPEWGPTSEDDGFRCCKDVETDSSEIKK